MPRLKRRNPEWEGNWSALEDALGHVFLGDYFAEEHDVENQDVTLEMLRDGVEALCDRWDYIPVFVDAD